MSATPPSGRIPVSVIIMTKDEEANLAKCLDGLRGFDEVFVVDSRSTDRTTEIAEQRGAHVIAFDWDGRYPKKKQWCLDNLPFSYDWILYLDADEEVTPEVAGEIEQVVQCPEHKGYFVGYDYVFMDRVLTHGRLVYKLVLFERHCARFPEHDDLGVAAAGEVELHFQPAISGTTGRLNARMLHNDSDTLLHFFERHNRYSDWEAVTRSQPSRRPKGEANIRGRRLLKQLFDLAPAKPVLMFIYSFVLKSGFRDGRAGFHYALALAFYVWQIGIKGEELKRRQRPASSRTRRG